MNDELGTKESCICMECQNACKSKPGWFKPGEAERTAQYLGMELQEFFERFLAVDWWAGTLDEPEDIFLLSPAIWDMEPGSMFPSNPYGECIFFSEGRCTIHAVKPFECREMLHGQDVMPTHRAVRDAWDNEQSQQQVVYLLAYEPEIPFGFDDVLAMLNAMSPPTEKGKRIAAEWAAEEEKKWEEQRPAIRE